MKPVHLLSLTGIGIAALAAACAVEETPGASGGTGATGNSGTGGGTSGGSGGTSGSGVGGSSATGGAGGTGGNGVGGLAGSGVGGGAGTTPVGGSAGIAAGGAAGTVATGGAAGTVATGGAGGTAGDAGGMAGSSGSAGSAGTGGDPPVDLPPLVTSAMGAFWNTSGTLTEGTGTATVTVNDTQVAQTWEGFGGSFNELGWKYLTSPTMQMEALTLLFSATDGANLTWGRIPIGASDYGETRYTLNDTGTDIDPVAQQGDGNRPPADTALANFSLTRDGMRLIPYIKAAQGVKPSIRFWASPWTPPVWMKTGYKTNSGGNGGGNAVRPSYFDGGNMRNDATILTAYAQYFVKFVEGYRAQGINVEIVSPQNEPGYDQNYPSCLWDSATYISFVGQHLGPAMAGLNPPVKVMLGTMSNAGDGGRNDIDIATAVLANSTARGFLSVVGVQWGVLDRVNSGQTFMGLPIWATEHKCGNYPWNPSGYPAYNSTQAPNDMAYGVESWGYIRNAIKNGKVTSYSAWNMVLDRLGLGNDTSRDWRQNALLVADGGMVTPTPYYYVFRHFAQYVQVGAQVVGVTGGDAVAFKNPDGSIVAVMYNSGAANNMYSVAMGGTTYTFPMPQAGWATVLHKP